MVLFQSSKLPLPPPSHLTTCTSILFEPNSLSLALMHSDSSLTLFPSLSSPFLSFLPPKPLTLTIPPPSSSSTFLLLHHQQDHPRILFLVAGPHKGGSQILFKLFVLDKTSNLFSKVQVLCNQKGIGFDPKVGVLMDINHGVSIKIVGSVNFFAMYSVSSKKVWVFAVKLIADDVNDVVKLMRCAVIECSAPVWSMSVSSGFLILGEDNGVRVFNLRQLVKGKAKKVNKKGSNSNANFDFNGKLRLPNGVIGSSLETTACNGFLDGKIDKHCSSVKQRFARCRQDSSEEGAVFVAFKSKNVEGLKHANLKAISIQALSPKTFMILDSSGDLHMLCLSNPVGGSSIICQMRQVPHSMKVQKMVVLPDISSRNQIVWVTDGSYSVHMMTVSDMDIAANKDDEDDGEEKITEFSVIQAIFADEKIQDLVPFASNGILILGQGNIYTYVIP